MIKVSPWVSQNSVCKCKLKISGVKNNFKSSQKFFPRKTIGGNGFPSS